MKVILASRNPDKLREMQSVLAFPGIEFLPVRALPGVPEVVEDGDTLEANAVKKARITAQITGSWALADDSGLEVYALNMKPGVHSARFAGKHGDYAANNRKLLELLRNVADRRARFRCVIALSSPAGRCRTVEGICAGCIADAPRGPHGFGYDPVFIPEGHLKTFAEMTPAEKNRLSHRFRAARAARRAWHSLLSGPNLPDWPD
ncbi:MAG TPA: RdgB/HAM1 family non-canonical purine NTP pyrophosphatase [Kiritimatiellae bacterium]|nr:RdgB/HAM1 family non-canonical purine NTP pyrophosphatase [Kiritimatiellia bacterium]